MTKKLVISPEYPQGIILDLTVEEIAQREQDAIKDEQHNLSLIAKEEQEKLNKQSALNKLKALGLNDAEIKAIIGI
jgi:hypothetical protein